MLAQHRQNGTRVKEKTRWYNLNIERRIPSRELVVDHLDLATSVSI